MAAAEAPAACWLSTPWLPSPTPTLSGRSPVLPQTVGPPHFSRRSFTAGRAAQVARVDLCRYRKSADWVMALHAPNMAGDTPLHTSMALPDIPEVTEIIQAFVAVGADISRPNSDGQSALDLAQVSLPPPIYVMCF